MATEEIWSVVEDENDDVDEQLVNAVWVVIFVCMVKVFGDPCRVWSKSDVEEEENEVDPYGEGSVVGDEVVWIGRRERDLRVLDRGRRDGDVDGCG